VHVTIVTENLKSVERAVDLNDWSLQLWCASRSCCVQLYITDVAHLYFMVFRSGKWRAL